MKKTSIIAALLLVAALGCKQKSSSTTEASSPSPSQPAVTAQTPNVSPEQLGEIGAQIKHHPSDADKILGDHGLTEEQFAKAIRQVASDPAASRRYRDAYKKAV
jgi:membrane-bound lytic murein transglycosylase B